MDKRIGRDLPAEDKMVARFAMERNKSSGKTTRKQKFNLADDDDGDMDAMGEMTTLTHFGQATGDEIIDRKCTLAGQCLTQGRYLHPGPQPALTGVRRDLPG